MDKYSWFLANVVCVFSKTYYVCVSKMGTSVMHKSRKIKICIQKSKIWYLKIALFSATLTDFHPALTMLLEISHHEPF